MLMCRFFIYLLQAIIYFAHPIYTGIFQYQIGKKYTRNWARSGALYFVEIKALRARAA